MGGGKKEKRVKEETSYFQKVKTWLVGGSRDEFTKLEGEGSDDHSSHLHLHLHLLLHLLFYSTHHANFILLFFHSLLPWPCIPVSYIPAPKADGLRSPLAGCRYSACQDRVSHSLHLRPRLGTIPWTSRAKPHYGVRNRGK